MTGFTTGSVFDPVVNAVSPFAAVSSIESTIKGVSPSAAHSLPDARDTDRDNSFFTIGAKMDTCAIIRSGGETSYHHQITV
jgi:hypothetical protein